MPPSGDRQLIASARQGDRHAFETLVEGSGQRLRASIDRQLGTVLRARVDLEDVVQETHLRAFRSFKRFREGGEEEFFRWLAGIARHVVLEAAKREKRDWIIPEDVEASSGDVSGSTTLRREERFDRLKAALADLSADYREVIVLARIERLPIGDIAERMGRTPEAISQLLWRATRKLKERFGATDSFHLPDRSLREEGTNGE